jgi:putative DNA primase/helicase
MSLPDFNAYCREACIKLWGKPDRETTKELRWEGGGGYGWRTFDIRNRIWYDAGAQRGGSTLELARYAKNKPPLKKGELRGKLVFETWQDAFELGYLPDPPPPKGNGKGGDNDWPAIRAIYPYPNETGELLFQVLRYDSEDRNRRFRQRQPDGKGGWIWKVKGTRLVLYRLPELIAAVKAGQRVLICEGERDVESAIKLGYTATTMPGGVGKWLNQYNEFFSGADVVVVSDNDPQTTDPKTGALMFHPDGRPMYAGQDHAAKVARGLSRVAKSVRTIILPQNKDLSEWIAAGGTREALDALIAAAPDQVKQRQPQQEEPVATGADGGVGVAIGEDRVALDFSALYADRLRYVALWNKWLEWDGTRWRFEDTLHAFDLARALCRKAALVLEGKNSALAAVVALARTDRRQAATVTQWDADPWLLGTPGGTVDLRTGELMPAQQSDYITKLTSVTPAGEPPEQSCPLWLKFLQRVTGGNVELQNFLQRVCGYALTGLTTEDSLFFLYGLGANGKSVFLRAVSSVLGDYHKTASMDMFTVTMGERHPTDLAMLRGARLVTAIETEEGKRWDESKLKAMTGGDPIAARFMRQDFFEYVPQFKLMIAGNHKPVFRNVDEAIRRRVKLAPFTVTIPEAERDKKLSKKLQPEWPGILRWMIDGCLAWQRDGLKPPNIVKDATDSYLTGQDDLQRFIDDACVELENEYDTSAHLWDGWTDWAEDNREFVGSQKRFSQGLEDKGYTPDRIGKTRTRGFRGIRCIRENRKKMAADVRLRANKARAEEAEVDAAAAKAKAEAASRRAKNRPDEEV